MAAGHPGFLVYGPRLLSCGCLADLSEFCNVAVAIALQQEQCDFFLCATELPFDELTIDLCSKSS